MKSRLDLRRILVAVLAGVLIGGGLMAVTPAGAEVAQSAATNWKKIWKKKLQPLADKRYYTKKQSDATFARKTDLGNYYTKAESDTKYQPKGNYALVGSSYTKAESDAKYVAKPTLITGSWGIGSAPTGGFPIGTISFGANLSAAPTTYILGVGAAPTVQCPGSAAAPAATAGNLCIYTNQNSAMNGVYTFGVRSDSVLVSASAGSNAGYAWGTWAVRPSGYAPLAAASKESASRSGEAPGR